MTRSSLRGWPFLPKLGLKKWGKTTLYNEETSKEKIMKNLIKTIAITATLVTATSASAAVCDYKPSAHIATATATITGATVAIAGSAATASHYYAISGMVGSTMAGSSAAGTVGIISGTAGTAGATAIAVLTAPATVTTGVVIVGAAAAFEGFCAFFGKKKVTTITPQPTDMRSKYKAHINQL
jgi:hypothetical protein